MPRCEQLTLPLFPVPSFEDLLDERRIRDVRIVFSARMKRGWHVSRTPAGLRCLTVPAYMREAPEGVKRALIEWARMPLRSKNPARRGSAGILEATIWEFIESTSAPAAVLLDTAALEAATRGVRYDLREVFETLNHRYFGGKLHACLRWGRTRSITSYFCVKRDTAGGPVNLITIAAAYNCPRIPRFAIEGIVYHEMLHIAMPPYVKSGRNVVHGPEFRRAQQRFRYYREWSAWERDRFPRIIGSLRRTRRRRRF